MSDLEKFRARAKALEAVLYGRPVLVRVDIDTVPAGTMIYNGDGLALGVVRDYREMNGNRASIPRRHLDNGKPKDRFAYRRAILYKSAKERGAFIVRKSVGDHMGRVSTPA